MRSAARSTKNKRKSIIIFFRTGLIFLVLIVVIFIMAYIKNSLPPFQLMITILSLSCIVFPAVLIIFFAISWVTRQKRKKKIFQALNLDRTGFETAEIYKEDFWKYTEYIRTTKVGVYTININLSEIKRNQIEVEILLSWRKIDKMEFIELEKIFKLENAQLGG